MVLTLYYLISGGIVLLGIIGFIIMASRRKYRSISKEDIPENEHIEHYTEIRDEVTVRKPRQKKVKEEDETSGGFNFVSLAVGIFSLGIIFMVGTQVLSAVQSSVCGQTNTTSFEGYGVASLGTCVNGKMEGGLFSIMLPLIFIGGFIMVMFNVFGISRYA
jgi:hypothetical protein